MQRRRKNKNFSKSSIQEAVLKLPQPRDASKSAYYTPLRNIIGGWKVRTLRTYLEEYRREANVTSWDPNCLNAFIGQPVETCIDEIIACCIPLGSLIELTRFLFSKFACQRGRFSRKGVFRIRLPVCRFYEQSHDNVLMMSFVSILNVALERHGINGSKVYKSNVYYVRKEGLSVFSLDRRDLIHPTDDAEFGILYQLDALPFFFVSTFTMPIDVIFDALQTALGMRLRLVAPKKDLPLHAIIKEEAKRAGLRRDAFPDHLKDLLHFQSNTLRQMVRRPDLTKYPTQHDCSSTNVSFQLAEGFEVSVKSRHHENILETLYNMEVRGQLNIPAKFVREVASDSKNSFRAFEFAKLRSSDND